MTDDKQSYADWKRWASHDFGKFGAGDARYFTWHLARSGIRLPARVLELGFGNGAFLGFARARGGTAVGIEIDETLRARGTAAGYPCHADLDGLAPEDRFDLIAAFDVLEHIPQSELPGVLGRLHHHLAEGGALLCRVPNGDSPFGRIHQHGDLTHVTTLGRSKFSQLAAMTGLEVVCHGEAPWHSMQGQGRSLRKALRALVRSVIERSVRFAYLWDDVDLAPNLVVVMRRRRLPTGSTRD